MTNPVEEQLLGHLLGALDESEQELVAARLESDPRLRREASLLCGRLKALDACRTDFVPPPGLAQRACRRVAAHAESSAAVALGRRAMSRETALPSTSGSIGWLDLTIAAGVIVAIGLMIVSGVQHSRFDARRLACQNNLRELGFAMVQFSENNGGYFPKIPNRGELAVAGLYAPLLIRAGVLTEPRRVVCPGSSLAGEKRFRVPTFVQLRTVSRQRREELRRRMGGSYGYHLGHMRGGVYQATKNLRRPFFVLMADAPGTNLPGYQSLNHGGRGQNVLFEDGRVEFVTTSEPNPQAGDFFLNDKGVVAAGVHRDDSVIGASAATPFVFVSDP